MLTHLQLPPKNPERVVILGAKGVIGKALTRLLEKASIPVLALSRDDFDLSLPTASTHLSSLLKPTDALVFLSTVTPDRGRGNDAFVKNILMAEQVSAAVQKTPPAHLIYLSSDTVYSLERGLVSEESPADPENLFGVMHLSREYLLKASTKAPVAILRSTLVFGVEDTHNSYGPNRLRRAAKKEGKITLFGQGEEKRDHIYLEDLVKLISLVLSHKSQGILNLITGQSISYMQLAQKIARLFDTPVEIATTPRQTPITHRHFDPSLIYKAFPSFCFKSLDDALIEIHKEEITINPLGKNDTKCASEAKPD